MTEYRPGPLAWLAIVTASCGLLLVLQKALWLIVPMLLALMMYYLLTPLKSLLLLRGFSHPLAALLVGLAALLAVVACSFVLVAWLSSGDSNWTENALRYIEGGLRLLIDTLSSLEERSPLFARIGGAEALTRHIDAFVDGFAARHLPGFVMGVAAWAPSVLLAPFITYFMLRDGWHFKRFLVAAIPNAFFERGLDLFAQLDHTARQYFIGLIKLTAIDTAVLGGGLWLLGFEHALLLALVAAVLAWIPYVGSIAGCGLVVMVAATDFAGQPGIAYGAVILFIAVRLLDDFVFMPQTIGRSLHMHPLLSVLMLFAGGALAGITGLMLVLPLTGICYVLGRAAGQVLTDHRLLARHRLAMQLRRRNAARGLDLPSQ